MKKVFALVLALALVMCGFTACSGKNGGSDTKTDADLTKVGEYTANNTEYVIGATGPLTGDASSYGNSVRNGAQLAVDEINAAGGLNGVNFKFDMKDDKAGAVEAGQGFTSLLEGGMQVSLGAVTSASCEAFGTAAAEYGIFFMTPSASAASVIETGDTAFRVCFGDPDQGTLAAEELSSKYNKIGAIYDTSDSYSSGIYAAFEAEMKKLGKEFTTQTFDKENNKDFSTQVEALKDCDVIFMPFYYTEAGLVAKACVAKNVQAELFGCDGFDGIAAQIDSTVTNHIRYITPFDVNSTKEKSAAFTAAYKATYNADPDQFAADAYDAVYVIYEGMKAAGVDDTSIKASDLTDKLVAAITASSFKYEGVTGTMTWATTGACTKEPNIVVLQ